MVSCCSTRAELQANATKFANESIPENESPELGIHQDSLSLNIPPHHDNMDLVGMSCRVFRRSYTTRYAPSNLRSRFVALPHLPYIYFEPFRPSLSHTYSALALTMATTTTMEAAKKRKTSSMDSSFPTLLPKDIGLAIPGDDYPTFLAELATRIDTELSTLADDQQHARNEEDLSRISLGLDAKGSKFIAAIRDRMRAMRDDRGNSLGSEPPEFKEQNLMFTENEGVAHRSTKSALLDLFVELEKTIDPGRLEKLLGEAWKADALATLRIIWNARSIHLGKGERETFYRCMGWLKEYHPVTFIANLEWLHRSVIQLKIRKDDPDQAVTVNEPEPAESGPDVLFGGSHSYWKDLLNLLVLDVQGELKATGKIHKILNAPNTQPRKRPRSSMAKAPKIDQPKKSAEVLKQEAKEKKHWLEGDRHSIVLSCMAATGYRILHLCVSGLFARQLMTDIALLASAEKKDRRRISYAAKWAPTLEGFHDKHTLIATSIAELLFPPSSFTEFGVEPRETYLKRAREAYRYHYLAPLRKALEVVERDISAETFDKIHYGKVPSLAMNLYKDLFARKDFERFETYIEKVAEGKARISGAVLLPGTLVSQVYGRFERDSSDGERRPGSKISAAKLRLRRSPGLRVRLLRVNGRPWSSASRTTASSLALSLSATLAAPC